MNVKKVSKQFVVFIMTVLVVVSMLPVTSWAKTVGPIASDYLTFGYLGKDGKYTYDGSDYENWPTIDSGTTVEIARWDWNEDDETFYDAAGKEVPAVHEAETIEDALWFTGSDRGYCARLALAAKWINLQEFLNSLKGQLPFTLDEDPKIYMEAPRDKWANGGKLSKYTSGFTNEKYIVDANQHNGQTNDLNLADYAPDFVAIPGVLAIRGYDERLVRTPTEILGKITAENSLEPFKQYLWDKKDDANCLRLLFGMGGENTGYYNLNTGQGSSKGIGIVTILVDYYDITVDGGVVNGTEGEDGYVSTANNAAVAMSDNYFKGANGEEITFTVTPDEGYGVTNVTSDDVRIKNNSDGTYSFTMTKNDVTINVETEEIADPAEPWDGWLDFTWYDENNLQSEYHISTPQQWEAWAWICSEHLSELANDTYSKGSYTNGNIKGYIGKLPTKQNVFEGVKFYLDNDIDMGGTYDAATATWSGLNYYPIGSQTTNDRGNSIWYSSFYGSFDGQGHIVNNVYLDRGNSRTHQSAGLFGRVGAADNKPAANCDITIENVAVTGYIKSGRSIGGIVGKTLHVADGYSVEIRSCINLADTANTDTKGVGGICGALWNEGIMLNCANLGNVLTNYESACAGGLVGNNDEKTVTEIKNSYTYGNISASVEGAFGGTIIGNLPDTSKNCYYRNGSMLIEGSQIMEYGTGIDADDMTTDDFAGMLHSNGEHEWVPYQYANSNIKALMAEYGCEGYPVPITFSKKTASDFVEHVESTEATCTEDGNVEYYLCTLCNKPHADEVLEVEINDVTTKATGHAMKHFEAKDATCEEDGNSEYYYCENCEKYFADEEGNEELEEDAWKIEATGHDWNDGVVTREATCEEAGKMTFTCKNDSKHTKTEDIEAIGHDWDEGVVDTEATCEETGIKVYTCKNDSEHINEEVIPATGHNWGVIEKIKEVTCTEDGEYKYKCENCGKVKTETVPATGHIPGDPVLENIVEPSSVEEGSVEVVLNCSQCGIEISREELPLEIVPENHAADKIKVTIENEVAATCEEDGSFDIVVTCEDCNEVLSQTKQTVEAKGHSAKLPVVENKVDATCEEDGSYDEIVYCSVCDKELKKETKTLSAFGHDWDEGVLVKEATISEEGLRTYTCKNDETHKDYDIIPKVDTKALENAISAATQDEKNTEVSEDGTDVAPSKKWVDQDMQDALDKAIEDANEVLSNPDATKAEVNAATKVLEDAIKAYDDAKQDGTGKEPVKATSIKIAPESAELATLDTLDMKVEVEPEDAEIPELIWVSSDEKVASVDEDGTVTAHVYGKPVKITAVSREDGSIKAYATIQTRFNDVNDKPNQYYWTPVYWAADKGITGGYAGGEYFGPQRECTRRELITFLWRIVGKPSAYGKTGFSDTDYNKNSDSYKAILWGKKKGIIGGYDDGTFRPEDPVKRRDAILMLYRVAGKPGVKGNVKFTDVKSAYKASSNTYKAILWGTKEKITGGYSDGTFKPDDYCLREHIVTFIYRYAK